MYSALHISVLFSHYALHSLSPTEADSRALLYAEKAEQKLLNGSMVEFARRLREIVGHIDAYAQWILDIRCSESLYIGIGSGSALTCSQYTEQAQQHCKYSSHFHYMTSLIDNKWSLQYQHKTIWLSCQRFCEFFYIRYLIFCMV